MGSNSTGCKVVLICQEQGYSASYIHIKRISFDEINKTRSYEDIVVVTSWKKDKSYPWKNFLGVKKK